MRPLLLLAGPCLVAAPALSQQPSSDARASVTVGTAAARRGQVAFGVLHVPAGVDSATDLPVAVINGARPGPTLALVAGSHGTEYTSIVALTRLIGQLDPRAIAGTVIVAPLVPGLLASHPALRIEIDPGESVVDLTRREADLALRTVRPVRGDLVVIRLATVRWVLVAAPEVARALGTLRSWTRAPWLGWGERLSGIAPARWLATHAPGAEPVVRCDSLMLQLALAKRGAGVALVPEPSASHYGLVPVKTSSALREDAGAWPSDDLFLVTHRALRQVPRVRVVWDLLMARVGERLGGR